MHLKIISEVLTINHFNKEKLAILIQIAIEKEKSLNQYALRAGISSAHISRISRKLLNTPPSPQALQKMANASSGSITYMELMEACGYIDSPIDDVLTEYMIGMSKSEYEKLSSEQKNQIRNFALFIQKGHS